MGNEPILSAVQLNAKPDSHCFHIIKFIMFTGSLELYKDSFLKIKYIG